jgi:hypothetical protein
MPFDEDPAAVAFADLDQPLLLQDPQRFAQGVAADIQQPLELALGGQPVPDTEAAPDDGRLHLLDDAFEGADLFDFGEHGGGVMCLVSVLVFGVWCLVIR